MCILLQTTFQPSFAFFAVKGVLLQLNWSRMLVARVLVANYVMLVPDNLLAGTQVMRSVVTAIHVDSVKAFAERDLS